MTNYKEKVCKMDGCGATFTPTTGNQKYCSDCKDKAKHAKNKILWRNKSRKKGNYKEYTVECKICGKVFTTYYTSKKYCGSKECEIERIRRKNAVTHERRSREEMIEKGRKYYKNNREKILLAKSVQYREENLTVKEYVFGKVPKHNTDYVRGYVESQGYELVSEEYINNRSALILKCPIGHIWTTCFHNFKDGGARCLHCYVINNYTSKFELEVRDHVSSIYNGEVVYNDRTHVLNKHTNRPLELDLYFPEYNKAIECNGEYWHSTDEAVERDRIKNDFCIANGIDLLTITDNEWLCDNGKDTVLNFIEH